MPLYSDAIEDDLPDLVDELWQLGFRLAVEQGRLRDSTEPSPSSTRSILMQRISRNASWLGR